MTISPPRCFTTLRISMDIKNFLYTTRFSSDFSIIPIGGEQPSFISKASLEGLKPLIPANVNFSENADLMGLAYNAAIINQANRNDDSITTADALAIVKNFIHKPTNIEHKKEKIVGHIASAGFSHIDGAMIQLDEAEGLNIPFNLSLGSVLYKYANPGFTQLVMRSLDPEDKLYQRISTSWEVGFNSFNIAVGSSNLAEAELVTDLKQVKELKKYLKAYAGAGTMPDGTRIFRVLGGELFPLGIGFTTNPAANVKGLYSDEDASCDIDLEIDDAKTRSVIFDLKKFNFNKKTSDAISQMVTANVKNTKETTMDIEKILSELKDLLVEKKFSQEAVASMSSVFADAIREKDQEFRDNLSKAEEAKASAINEQAELKTSVTSLREELDKANTKISEFETFQKQEEAVARFNSRMESLDKDYDLEDEDRKVLIEELKGLGASEEAFASYKDKVAVFWKDKSKEAKASFEKAVQIRIDAEVEKKIKEVSTASVIPAKEVTAEEALAHVKETTPELPNTNQQSTEAQPSLRDKFAKAFSRENIEISH